MNIYFIYAKGCKRCKEMRECILGCQLEKKKIKLIEIDSETEDALNYAVENGIEDIPACKIGNVIVQGEDFDPNQIINEINTVNEKSNE